MEEPVLYDVPHPCPYLPGRTARTPLRVPTDSFTPQRFDICLAEGDRRTGNFLYRNECNACNACEPIRIPVNDFVLSRNARRVLNRGNRLLEMKIAEPIVDDDRVALFNLHRNERGMNNEKADCDHWGYESFLVETCCDTFEISYRLNDRLACVAICDQGANSMSAVYSYFDPALGKLSLGVYSILQQIELCRQRGMEYLYLGFYVEGSPHMKYKARYKPHERLIAGQWVWFD